MPPSLCLCKLGLLASLSELGYEIKSNRESGFGRYDVCLFPKDTSKLGIIFEFKKATDKTKNLSGLADFAIKQIEKLHYVTELKSRGVQKILALGFGFKGKDVHVKSKFIS